MCPYTVYVKGTELSSRRKEMKIWRSGKRKKLVTNHAPLMYLIQSAKT
jgi:hypothetical protein